MSRVLLAIGLVVALGLAWQLWRAFRAYRVERSTLFPPRGTVAAPEDSATLGLTNVSFPSRDSTQLRGWYVPSRNGASIILVHGSGSDRSSMLTELRFLVGKGFGILAFDLPGHGESGGDVSFGAGPASAVQGAADFVLQHSDVHDGRLGVAGFSYGGAIVARAAASDCQMRAVALVAAPADAVTQTREEYASYGRAAQLGAFAVYWIRGIDLGEERAVDYVGKIAPRPLLIVGSADDTTVPLSQTQALVAAAGEQKRFVLLPHGAHGRFAEADSTYLPTLGQFFESTLLAPTALTDCPK